MPDRRLKEFVIARGHRALILAARIFKRTKFLNENKFFSVDGPAPKKIKKYGYAGQSELTPSAALRLAVNKQTADAEAQELCYAALGKG